MENQNGYELLKERAKSLAVMLTLEEKIGMIHGGTSFSTQEWSGWGFRRL